MSKGHLRQNSLSLSHSETPSWLMFWLGETWAVCCTIDFHISPGFEHMISLKLITFCLIYWGRGLERNDCRLHCRNDLPKYAKWIKMGQLMQNCKSSSKIHCKSRWYQDTCAHSQLPALAAETLSASLTWNVKRFIQHLYTVKWQKFDTWHMVIHGSIYTSNPPWSLQRALTGSWRKCHMFFNVSQ